MVRLSTATANWRLFGGGGLILGGLLWLVGALVRTAELEFAGWIVVAGLLVIAVSHLFVAFGQTGSNGAVGSRTWGKAVLVIAAIGWAATAVVELITLLGSTPQAWVPLVATALVVFGGLLAAIAIFDAEVARGIARIALFAPVGAIAVTVFLPLADIELPSWAPAVVAALVVVTGVAYLFNGFLTRGTSAKA